MSASQAMEDAFGIKVDGPARDLRRLIFCGEWIESHGLHVYLLHAPDFLGYQSAVHMAADHREIVEQGLALKKVGNDLMTILGGREIHPINVRVGGWYRVPRKAALRAIQDRLEWAKEASLETVRLVAGFTYPDVEVDYEFVAVDHPDEYPIIGDRIVSNRGIDIPVQEWRDVFVEEHVARSNALHARIRERGAYHVGPLARYALSYEKLSPDARRAAEDAGLGPVCRNPFRSIIVRAVEMVHACDEALAIIDAYEPPDRPFLEVHPRAAVGHGVSEAPRGLLYHRYELDDDGTITDAQIAPPTAQNQLTIEADLRVVLDEHIDLPDHELSWVLEQSIRNYDPCISCATHFLKLTVDRSG
jgi:sulfhydrogenase subunit alpha